MFCIYIYIYIYIYIIYVHIYEVLLDSYVHFLRTDPYKICCQNCKQSQLQICAVTEVCTRAVRTLHLLTKLPKTFLKCTKIVLNNFDSCDVVHLKH
jgi:hypothetical protein